MSEDDILARITLISLITIGIVLIVSMVTQHLLIGRCLRTDIRHEGI